MMEATTQSVANDRGRIPNNTQMLSKTRAGMRPWDACAALRELHRTWRGGGGGEGHTYSTAHTFSTAQQRERKKEDRARQPGRQAGRVG